VASTVEGRSEWPQGAAWFKARKASEIHCLTNEIDILVRGGGASFSFSKGILSQSLLAAAIDPHLAFEIARDIEQGLVADGVGEIARDDLREIAHAAIKEQAGAEAADRYLIWRRYEVSEEPVILLLGGTSGVGKTTLALEVARRLGIGRVLSTDSIRQVMRLMISRDLMPWIHASSFDAYLTMDAMSEPRPNVLAGFRAQASAVAVGVRASIERSVEEGANLVVDGVSLLPGAIDEQRFSGQAVIVFVLVATLDESALGNRFEARATGQPRRLAHRYLEHKKEILEIQRHLIAEAERRAIPVVDNTDLDRSAREIIAHVLDRLRHEQRRVAGLAGEVQLTDRSDG
jgi:2-phosphoglycerate kinase